MNRPLTGIVYTPGGTPWPNARVYLRLKSDPAVDDHERWALRVEPDTPTRTLANLLADIANPPTWAVGPAPTPTNAWAVGPVPGPL